MERILAYIDIPAEEIVLYLDPSDKNAIKSIVNLRHFKYNQEGIWLSFDSLIEFSEYFRKIPPTCKYRKFSVKIFNNRMFKEGI
ncbi:MAG: hypothetical protein AB7E28_08335 [Desulfurella sp.]|jgi:hypothetical protein